jgi:dihydrofolate reductase
MRKLIYAINTSIDGVCDHTKVPPPDNEVGDYYTRLLRDIDVFVYGRITYQLMVPYWPDIAKNRAGDKWDLGFAEAFESVSKVVVFSRSLARVEEARTRIVRGNLKDEVLKLKEEQGKDILVGGVSIPAQLMELGLIDEYRILVNPAVVGEGKRLFDGVNLPQRLQLKLVDSRTFESGCILLRYSKQ